jgi:hypothetical protein
VIAQGSMPGRRLISPTTQVSAVDLLASGVPLQSEVKFELHLRRDLD